MKFAASTPQEALDKIKLWSTTPKEAFFYVSYCPNAHFMMRYQAGYVVNSNGKYDTIIANFADINGIYYPKDECPPTYFSSI